MMLLLSYFLCQQIRPTDIWRESQQEDMHCLDPYHLRMTLYHPFSGSIEFEGTTDSSHLKVKYGHRLIGMKVV